MSHLFKPPINVPFINPTTKDIDHNWLEWLRLLGVKLSAGVEVDGDSGIFASFDAAGNIVSSGYAVDDTETDNTHLWTADKINTLIVATGDVTGPASSTNNAVVRFDLATGKLVQDSGVIIDDLDNVDANTYKVSGTQVIGTQQTAEADASTPTTYTPHTPGGTTVTSNAATDLDTTAAALDTLVAEVASLTTTVNNLLTKLRTHGIIAT